MKYRNTVHVKLNNFIDKVVRRYEIGIRYEIVSLFVYSDLKSLLIFARFITRYLWKKKCNYAGVVNL